MKKYGIIIIILLGFFLRFYLLNSIPAGVTSDEADNGYDAYSILKTGSDQWGAFMPTVSFKGFGDFRSPLYTYLLVPSVAYLGLTSLAVKFPSALAGVLSIFLIYLIAKQIFNTKVGYFSAFLFAISPWSIGLSRQGIESNVAMLFYLVGLYFFMIFKKNIWYLYVSALFFLLTFYTYTVYLIFTPLSFILLVCLSRRYLKTYWRHFILVVLILLIGVFPLIHSSGSAGNVRFSQVGIISDTTSIGLIEVLNQKIGSCSKEYSNIFCRLFENKYFLFSSKLFQNYVNHFSFDFLYITGTTTQYSLLYERGLFYLFEVTFLISGLFTIIAKRKGIVIVLLVLLAVIPDALSGPGHHSRASAMLPFMIIIEAVGLVYFVNLIFRLKSNYLKYFGLLFLGVVIVFSLFSFALTYFTHFYRNYSSYSQYIYSDLSNYLNLESSKYSAIYVSNVKNDAPMYIFYLFYNKYDPKIYQSKKMVGYSVSPNGFITVNRIGNIYFSSFVVGEEFNPKTYEQNSLFIGHPDIFPKNIKTVKIFEDLGGLKTFQAVEYRYLASYFQDQGQSLSGSRAH